MLVFRRRPGYGQGSSFTIGGAIKVAVLKVDRQGASIGITAPANVPIIRDDAIAAHSGHIGAVIDARITQLAAIVANVEAPQFDRVRSLSQLVEHCTICGHSAGQNAGHSAGQNAGHSGQQKGGE